MKFVHTLTIKAKLYLLSLFILGSLLIITLLSYNTVESMKKNLDALYFGSLIPIADLNQIIAIYNEDIKDRYINIENERIAKTPNLERMAQALVQIKRIWNGYATSYKSPEELPYIDYTTRLVEQSEDFILSVIERCYDDCRDDDITSSELIATISRVSEAIKKLVAYESSVAKFARHKLLKTYENTIFRIVIIVIAVALVVLLLSFVIFRSISLTQQKLKETTKELQSINKKLESASYTDSLTQLYNRRYFNFIFERELKRAIRDDKTVAFMMLDIDYFKQYNDYYGHLEGDNALKQVSRTLRSVLKRPSDYVFRLGGEEFGILLCDSSEQNAHTVAQSINETILEQRIEHAMSQAEEFLTVSIGVVVIRAENGIDMQQIIDEADRNLYKAKHQGRNRFVATTIDE